MKFSVECGPLQKALSHVQGVVDAKPSSAILANFLLEARGSELRITGTDQTMQIEEDVTCSVETPGATTVLADRLVSLIKNLPNAAMIGFGFEDGEKRVVVRCGRGRWLLPVLPAADFPKMPVVGMTTHLAVDADELTRLIDKTRYAAHRDAVKGAMNGIYLHAADTPSGAVLRATATDGLRLAIAETAAPKGLATNAGVILPLVTALQLLRLLDAAGENVEVSLSATKAAFNLGSVRLISKVIDGHYLPYEAVMQHANGVNALKIERDLLGGALARSMTLQTEKARPIRFGIEDGKVTVTTRGNHQGQGVEELDADLTGEATEVTFNAGFMLDVVNLIGGEHLSFHYGDRKQPFLVTDSADPRARHIIVPQVG